MQSTGLMYYHKFQVVLVLNKDIKLSNLRQCVEV